MDAIEFLKREHATAKSAFGKIEQAQDAERGRLWKALKPELEVHEQIEETCVYGPISHEAAGDTVLASWRTRHQDEVAAVDRIIKEIDSLEAVDPRWLATVKDVKRALEKHIQEEEQDIFPRVAQVWDRTRLEAAGSELEQMKARRLRSAA